MNIQRIKCALLAAVAVMTMTACAQAGKVRIKTGIEVLKSENFKCLEGKRVGLITNPTGVDNDMKSTIDILHEAKNVNLVALYGPEHGVRGNVHAGMTVTDVNDATTGLPVYSLYGSTRKMTKEMLDGIDVIVYDIQDIGCRSFTYISTMGLAMEAAAENGKEFVVLDRPNPLGGKRVEGCLVDDGFYSFVSQFKIPYLYGLTCGELAMMLNGERMLEGGKQCKLTVVKMKGWKRDMNYMQTGLQWIPSSPHIPHAEMSFYYPVSGIVGEFSHLSIGVGYTIPFEMFGAPWADGNKLAARLNALKLPGITFRTIYATPFYAAFKGENIEGVQAHITDFDKVNLTEVQFLVVQKLYAMHPDHPLFCEDNSKRYNMFDKVSGTSKVRELFGRRYKWDDVKDYWNKDVAAFKALSKKYYLYR